MAAYVVDVNVAIVANGQTPQADPDCVLACLESLRQIAESGLVVLDDGTRIQEEYMRNLRLAGWPGAGDAFMKWVWENLGVEEHCERVHLTPHSDDPDDFTEFPCDPALNTFDRNDRKYVAVALASPRHPEVLNAVDTDWWNHREALLRHGVRLRFLCPQHMQ